SPSLDQKRRGLTLLDVSTTLIYNLAGAGEIPATTACGGLRGDDYWPGKWGGGRWRKELRASWTSWGARRANRRPKDSWRSCSSSVDSILCCRVRRAACMATGGQEAMDWASAMASPRSLSAGTNRSRRPIRYASSASTKRLV